MSSLPSMIEQLRGTQVVARKPPRRAVRVHHGIAGTDTDRAPKLPKPGTATRRVLDALPTLPHTMTAAQVAKRARVAHKVATETLERLRLRQLVGRRRMDVGGEQVTMYWRFTWQQD